MGKQKHIPYIHSYIHSFMIGYASQSPTVKSLAHAPSVYWECQSAGSLGRRTIRLDGHYCLILMRHFKVAYIQDPILPPGLDSYTERVEGGRRPRSWRRW